MPRSISIFNFLDAEMNSRPNLHRPMLSLLLRDRMRENNPKGKEHQSVSVTRGPGLVNR